MKKILDAIDRFEEAAVDKSWIGSKELVMHPYIEEEYKESKESLIKIIQMRIRGVV